jgi:hypothetical protein
VEARLRIKAGSFFTVAAMLIGCPPANNMPGTELVPDFSLPDINPNSARFNQNISPRDYLGSASAWYFGHAT